MIRIDASLVVLTMSPKHPACHTVDSGTTVH